MFKPIRLFACISLCALLHSPLYSYGQNSRQSEALNYFSFPGQPLPTKALLSLLERQARWDDAGPGDLILAGLRVSPSGFHLRFEKIDEQVTPGGRVMPRYRVFAEGAPENKVFAISTWPMDKAISNDPRDIYVNGQGLLMLRRPKPEQELSLKAGDDEFNILPVTDIAEPVRYLLSTRYGPLSIPGTLVPHPVVSEDHGCRLEAIMAQPNAKAVLIVADRFPAKAKIPLVLESEDVISIEMLTTNADGHAVMAVFPYLRGKTHGMLKANAEGPNCLPNVVLPWGTEPHAAPKTPPR
jgi:hypothetical protein